MTDDRDSFVTLEVTMEQVPLFNVMDGEWWFHEGRWHICRCAEDPHPDTKVYVQIPRGLRTLNARQKTQ